MSTSHLGPSPCRESWQLSWDDCGYPCYALAKLHSGALLGSYHLARCIILCGKVPLGWHSTLDGTPVPILCSAKHRSNYFKKQPVWRVRLPFSIRLNSVLTFRLRVATLTPYSENSLCSINLSTTTICFPCTCLRQNQRKVHSREKLKEIELNHCDFDRF